MTVTYDEHDLVCNINKICILLLRLLKIFKKSFVFKHDFFCLFLQNKPTIYSVWLVRIWLVIPTFALNLFKCLVYATRVGEYKALTIHRA
jgi:hypothetical protein